MIIRPPHKTPHNLRTWIEIDRVALHHNVERFLQLIGPDVRLMAIIKSNAYGHGLVLTARALAAHRDFSEKGWFGVDSMVEALRLRREGIKNPILVLGMTIAGRIPEAAAHHIALTVSTRDALKTIIATKPRPVFHIKIDTGMHRQGFLPPDIAPLLQFLKKSGLKPEGIYTHFAMPENRAFTLRQIRSFDQTTSAFVRAGFRDIVRHASATRGVLRFPEARYDMVRVGIGLYGYEGNGEKKAGKGKRADAHLKPVLTWKTIVGEIKEIPKGSYVGYDLTERVSRSTQIAVLPVGYWHGYDRGLSSIGTVLLRGGRCRILGRVSMDMTTIDITNINGTGKRDGGKGRGRDEIILIGRSGNDAIWADEIARQIGTTAYEVLTRINPLIKRIEV